MTACDSSCLAYYSRHGLLTDPGPYRTLLDDLPHDIPALVKIVQGLLVHVFWMQRYGLKVPKEREQELELRSMPAKLARILELDPAPLNVARPLDRRLVGNCRDFTLTLISILQAQGVPARARCGFGAYFLPDHYEDHWVCEYWNPAAECWVMVDAQLDAFQREALHTTFDTLDVPADQFVNGGRAWQMVRSGGADSETFGIFDMHGMWFIRGDLVRDFLALNQFEILPWDHWGLISKRDEELTAEDMAQLDRMAALCVDSTAFDEVRALYESNPALHPPADYMARIGLASIA
ncbi:MAG: transglutaminase domain-containing protein [Anaerolineae bacterium]